MNVIILAAGRGTRFSEDTPKCLCTLGAETIISRQIKQVRGQWPEAKIVVVTGFENTLVQKYSQSFDENVSVCYNGLYESDQNIYSGLRGVESSMFGTLILEGDCVFSDEAFEAIAKALEENNEKSIFFLGAVASTSKTNAIVKINARKKFNRFVMGKRRRAKGYYNMTGATWIAKRHGEQFLSELETLCSDDLKQYYFQPLLNNPVSYNLHGEVIGDTCYTFNTKEEYLATQEKLGCAPSVELFDVSKLKHIEDYDRDAVKELTKKIRKEGRWTRPLCIDPDGLVMDGQHRMEVALAMKLSKVPVVIYEYGEVPIYSLREDEEFTYKDVVRRAKKGDIYPYKTVKHIFNEDDLLCDYDLKELK